MNKETVLVTGGAGAIGSNLCKALNEQEFKVVVLDDLSSGSRSNIDSSISFRQGSVTDPDITDNVFKTYHPRYVVHLAALFANQNSVDHPQLDLEVNIKGTLNILGLCNKYKVDKVVYTSSSCVYGRNCGELKETMHNPVLDTPYAISKLAGEYYCNYFRQHFKLKTIILRLFNSYGPGEMPGKYRNVIPNFFNLALSGKPLTITGNGNETRDFNFVEDTVQGIYKALKYSGDEHVFNIGSGKQTKIIDLANQINTLAGNESEVVFLQKRSWDYIDARLACIEAAEKELDYHPVTSLADGLKKTFQWIRKYV